MNRLSISFATLALSAILAGPAIAGDTTSAASDRTLGTVVNGDTTTEFKAAGTHGLDMNKLRPWSAFAADHPAIAKELAYKPALIGDDAYAKNHPELESFFSTHPDIREAMIENPGNFVAIPPRPGE
ncbi:MAG: hypothetical protein Q7S58_19565 [Candidatus Binatus sp.]|uniref:hypothetical protein n=1 Tax=Candidatus Binatus sp. TaxID=2811406 RepID=UPI002720706B|nr:hypothetical protein [Candidatus Binatus sp.]MDO8434601.1 hypothetical protein [Candidatus Binatus sp.]